MVVLPGLVPFMFPLVTVTVIKPGEYPIGLNTTDFIEVNLMVSLRRLVIRVSFYRQRNLINKSDVVIKIQIRNVCDGDGRMVLPRRGRSSFLALSDAMQCR